jgi:hypothetical protein
MDGICSVGLLFMSMASIADESGVVCLRALLVLFRKHNFASLRCDDECDQADVVL